MAGDEPILVIGGTGKTGRRVAARLWDAGQQIRIGSRAAETPFDWNDRRTWGAAVEGARAAYVTYYPDIALPGAVETISTFLDTALAAGLRRIVLLSGRGEPEAQRAEAVLMESGAEWTVVRASWFMQNFSENFLLDGIQAGEVVFPRGDVPEPFVDADDIADVAVAALTEEGHVGKLYEVTGPRLLSFRQALAEIAAAAGRPVAYREISPEGYAEELRRHDVPPEFRELLEVLTREVLDGRNAYLANGVQQALGRRPRDFADFARQVAASGLWAAEAA